jgi:hypothetical protein
LKPSDLGYAEAQDFRRFLDEHGFQVQCVIRSTFASFVWPWPEAAFLTDRGDLEVRFFPSPDGAERVRINEAHTGRGWRYSFPGHSGGGDTLYALRRQYFLRNRRWLVVLEDSAVASTLRRLLPELAKRTGAPDD